ncbi:helix-turn-helix domain-containing protein [Hoeflea sp. YIM 152468]|uniref:helix-turn-helix domain-containing protein n=1 Tax=Hoeflea sp. YIM 152468 TaxID=3031759 RepID=UPI0023DA391D|nr:helix-turn-helix domain-containing protein [Hoeflea sp. YIM 152468]MDF1608499.1 helix-turn-helix domain-containing protein [Hoeflea sp. YIM 152468]
MGEIQKLTIEGKTYVLLSEDDYEDMIDTLEANAIMARIKEGEETWPHELVVALAQTDSRIRTYRKYRGLTMMQLAEAAGISQPYLSDIENGKKAGSIDVLKRIAAALRVDLDDLVV